MSTASRVMMSLVLAIVWGGFILTILLAMRRERAKQAERRRRDAD